MVTVNHVPLPIATLAITTRFNGKDSAEPSEPVYGGYANPRGDIFLFAKDQVAYRVNFKSQTLQRRPPLNPGAQARYDATEAGESFDFGNRSFRRLSHEQITGDLHLAPLQDYQRSRAVVKPGPANASARGASLHGLSGRSPDTIGEPQEREQSYVPPGQIELVPTQTVARRIRECMMVVMPAFTPRD